VAGRACRAGFFTRTPEEPGASRSARHRFDGLLVLTQDGRVAKQLIGDDSDVEKEYLVRVEGPLDDRGFALLNHGLSLDGKSCVPPE